MERPSRESKTRALTLFEDLGVDKDDEIVGAMEEARIERHKKKKRKVNQTDQQNAQHQERNMISHMTNDQIERQRSQHQSSQMTNDQNERHRNRNQLIGMTPKQIDRQRSQRQLPQMNQDQVEQQRIQHRLIGMTPERIVRQNEVNAVYRRTNVMPIQQEWDVGNNCRHCGCEFLKSESTAFR
jgi:hypothetical protein